MMDVLGKRWRQGLAAYGRCTRPRGCVGRRRRATGRRCCAVRGTRSWQTVRERAPRLNVGVSESQAAEQALRLEAPFGGEQADASFVALDDRLVIEIALGGGEIAGGEETELIAIGAVQHRAEFSAGMFVPRGGMPAATESR